MKLGPPQHQGPSHRRRGAPARKALRTPKSATAFEREADRASDAVARGQRSIGRGLTPAPAASVHVPGVGRPLPTSLRQSLETSFGADLAAVRIHADSAAAHAARAEGAKAFTAGADIFFGAGHYAPHTEDGYRLVAHEVAHVLQQTGRRGADRQLRATAQSGSGNVQCDKLSDLPSAPGNDELKKLAAEHRAFYSGADTALETMIEHVIDAHRKDFQLDMEQYVGAKELSLEARKGNDGGKPSARGFLIDCLKLNGGELGESTFEAAATILDREGKGKDKFEIKTRRVEAFTTWLKTHRNEEWAGQGLAHDRLRGYWIEGIQEAIRPSLYNPWVIAPASRQDPRPEQLPPLWGVDFQAMKSRSWKDQKAALDSVTGPDFTERQVLGRTLIDQMDEFRLTALCAWEKETAGQVGGAAQRRHVALRLQEKAKVMLAQPGIVPYLQEMWLRLQTLAQNAVDFWNRGATAVGSRAQFQDIGDIHDFTATLLEPATKLLQSPMPDSAQYAERLAVLRKALVGTNPSLALIVKDEGGFFARMQQRIKDATTAGAAPPLEVAWIVTAIIDLVDLIDKFKGKDDAASAYPDGRDAHRFRMALFLADVAGRTNATDLGSVAAPVVAGEGAPRFVVAGSWEEEDVDVEKLLEDFAPGYQLRVIDPDDKTRAVLMPVTAQILAYFYKLEFYDELNRQLSTVVKELDVLRAANLLKGDTLVKSGEAQLKAKQALKQPRRWHARDFEFIPKLASRVPSRPLIEQNAKTRDIVPSFEHWLVPERKEPPIIWVLPPFDKLVTWLKQDTLLVQAVADWAKAASKPVPTDPVEWLAAAGKATTDTAKLLARLFESLVHGKGGLLVATREYAVLVRRATTYRRRITDLKISEELKIWNDGHRSYNITHIDEAYRQVWTFGYQVIPHVDRDAQSALLVLTVADEIDEAFPESKCDQFPSGLKPYLDEAIVLSEDTPDNRTKLYPFVDDTAELESLLTKRAKLQAVVDRYVAWRAKQQATMGFMSDDGTTLKSLVYYTSIKPGEEFSQGQMTYKLIKVHRPFFYNKALKGTAPRPSVLKESKEGRNLERTGEPLVTMMVGRGDKTPESIMMALADKYLGRTVEEGEEPLNFENDPDPETFVVTDKHDNMLGFLSDVIEDETMKIGLEQTALVLEVFSQVIITGTEIIIPGGSEIAIAEVTLGVIQVLGDPSVEEMIRRLSEDPESLVTDLTDRLKKVFTPEGIWELAFSNKFAWLEELAHVVAKNSRKRGEVTTPPTGKLGRIFRFIVNLGKRFMNAFKRIRHLFRAPIGAFRSAIVTRPRLAWFLAKAVDLLIRVADWVGDHPDFENELADMGKDFKDRLTEFVQTLSEVELPGEILPVEDLLSFLIDFVVGQIPKVKILRPILRETGVFDLVSKELVKAFPALKTSVLNAPNELYSNLLHEYIDPKFHAVRDALVKDLCDAINWASGKLGLDLKVAAPTDDEMGSAAPKTVPVMDMYPEGEPAGGSPEVPVGGGEPIDPRIRADVQRRFGEDFAHVRLHRDKAAQRLTRAHGAAAITSGSNIFMRRGLGPDSAAGMSVLEHELAHVLQQTGSRPLGGEHDPRPRPGTPGLGLRIEPIREDEAERIAARARTGGHRVPAGLQAQSTGLQPIRLSADTLRLVASTVTESTGEGDFEEPVAAGEKVQGVDKAGEVWTKLKAALTTEKTTWKPFCSGADIKRTIINQVKENAKVTDKDIAKVAALAQKNLPRAQQTAEVKKRLDVKRFATLLEGFLFLRCGIAIQIAGPKDDSTDVTGLTVYYVNLGHVGGTSLLWKTVMADERLKALDPEGEKLRREIRRRLEDRPPEPFIWKQSGSDFKFSQSFIDELKALLEIRAQKGKPKTVPVASDYANTATAGDAQGLRVGTHGELRKKTGYGRESHHTTQFLLVEYFRNRNDTLKPFPEPFSRFNGALFTVEAGKKYIDKIKVAGTTFDLRALDSSSERGDGMPAILIAAETHRKGKLHINASDNFDEDGDQGGQADKVEAKFTNKLPGDLVAAMNKPVTDPTRIDDYAAYVNAHAVDVATGVLAGMKEAYRAMYAGHMQGALTRALKDLEKPYYEGIAARTHSDGDVEKLPVAYQLTPKAVEDVDKAAVANNDKLMKDWK